MLDGTQSIPTRSPAAPGGRRTPLLAGLCLCLAVLAGCGTRGTPAPVTDLTQEPAAPAASSGTAPLTGCGTATPRSGVGRAWWVDRCPGPAG